MSKRSTLVKGVPIVALKFWSFQICLGLQSGSHVSSELQVASKYQSCKEFIHPQDYCPPEGLKHNLHKIVESKGNQRNHVADHSYDAVDRRSMPSDLSIVRISTSDPKHQTEKIGPLDYCTLFSPQNNIHYGLELQPTGLTNTVEQNGSSLQDLFNTQTIDMFDHRQYIDEYLQYFEHRNTNTEQESQSLPLEKSKYNVFHCLEQNLGQNMMTKINAKLMPSQHQYSTACHQTDKEPISLNRYHLETQGISTLEPFPTERSHHPDSPNDITLNRMPNEKVGILNQPIEEGQGGQEFQKTRDAEPVLDYLERPHSKKRKRKTIKTVKKINHYTLEKLDMDGSSTTQSKNRNQDNSLCIESKLDGQKNTQLIRKFGWDSICQGVLNKEQISPWSESCLSAIRIDSHSIKKLPILQKIGVINTNRSPKLCYEIYEFFHEIYCKIKGKITFSDGEVEAVRLAIRNAGYGVVMTFLGILRVFEADNNRFHDIDSLLCNGWSFIQEFYSTWKTVDFEHFHFGTSFHFDSSLSYDPYFHLKYLKQVKRTDHVPLSLVHSISLLWSKRKGQSKIPKDLLQNWEQVENVSKIDSISIQGGLYGRLDLKSMSFWGPKEFARTNWHLYGGAHIHSQELWSWASDAAQFHTSVGRETCRNLHMFFEDLIQKLHISYNDNLKQVDPSPMLQSKSNHLSHEYHSKNLGLIVKAVSISEYRVAIPFIGIVKILNEDNLTSDQLQKLLENATEFLKETFFQWNQLDFHPQNVHKLFHHTKHSRKLHNAPETPETIFKIFFGFANSSTFPSRIIMNLLRLWHKSITKSKLIPENDLQFPISDIPSVSYSVLEVQFKHLLANHYPKTPRNIFSDVGISKRIPFLLKETFATKNYIWN
ncbi:hypothetical protein DFH28DRAFT_959650 [Melampsora americana]|nr:hypothetical protein DFH28DRAFT_959650 [Melampsora americana]